VCFERLPSTLHLRALSYMVFAMKILIDGSPPTDWVPPPGPHPPLLGIWRERLSGAIEYRNRGRLKRVFWKPLNP